MRRTSFSSALLVALSAPALAWSACGGDGSTDTAGGIDGGADAAMPATDGGPSMTGCVHTGPPLVDPEELPVCDMCPNARCLPTGVVPMEQQELLADCDESSKCVPELFIRTNGDFLLDTCRSIADAEGRCVSICLPDVAAQMDFLPQASCADDERCAPCFDPTTGEDTGVCGQACDPGPTEPPLMLDPCCGGEGVCLPPDAVPPAERERLGADACSDGALCVPSALASGTPPPMCRSIGMAEGRCLPSCLPEVAEQADRLPQDSCADGSLCLPCYDPTTGESTGACELFGDMPTEDPVVFEGCCEHGGTDRGRCVPASVVPEEDRDGLPMESCTMGELCVPEPLLLDPGYTFPSCMTEGLIGGGDPGACVPDCMVGGFEGFLLNQSTCAEGELCAPCMDPITGDPTGACR